MNLSISHLPEYKQQELRRITDIVRDTVEDVEQVILFGSHARGDWIDGPHEQGKGRLTIHKKSDYDILVITRSEYVARDVELWQTVKRSCEQASLSAFVRIIPRDIHFINEKLREGHFFFTEVIEQGVVLFDSGRTTLESRHPLNPAEEMRLAQGYYDEIFKSAQSFFKGYTFYLEEGDYKLAAFSLHQACEHAYKALLLIYGGECPQEHHLDILGDQAAEFRPAIANLPSRQTRSEKERFELLDYAYIGARYDFSYAITKDILTLLASDVEKLHQEVNIACREKIEYLGQLS